LSGPWTQQRSSGTINRNGSGLGVGSVNAKDLFAYWSANAFGNDQYSQVRIAGGLSSGSQYVQIIIRAAGRGDGTYNNYLFYTDGVAGANHTEVAKNINGTQITLRSFPTTFTTGDVIKIAAVGTAITCYKNGVALGTITDASLQSGAPGVGVYGNTVRVDDWEGGSSITVAEPVAAVTVSPASTTLPAGSKQQLTATTTDANNNVLTGRAVTWSSDNASASVDPSGLVTAISPGTATISATSEGKVGTAAITVTPGVAPSDTESESFTGVAAPLSGSWTQQRTSGTINKNGTGLGIGSVGAKDLFAYWSATSFANDQFSQARIAGGLAGGSQWVQITVRASGSGDGSYNNYLFYTDGVAGANHTEVAKNINGVQTALRSFPVTFAIGDIIRISVSGTTITCYKNGVPLGTVTDASLASGSPGVGVYGSAVTVDDWQGGSTTTAPASVASVSVSPSSASIVVSSTRQLTAVVRDANGTALPDRAVAWSSDNTAVATVDATGLVTAVSAGAATITATSEGKTGSTAITVTLVPVANVAVSPISASLMAGTTRQFTATTTDANNNTLTGRAVSWASSNTAVATINASTGLLTAVAPGGPVTITATSEGKTGTASVTVTPVPVATVTVSPSAPTISVGDVLSLTTTLRDANNNVLTGRVVTWNSDAPSVASVNPTTGVVSGASPGAATITATSEGKTGTAYVNVRAVSSGAGPLRVSSRNPRYFENGDGQIVYLTGSHTWSNLQDNGTIDPPPAFDFAAYLNFLVAHGHNFTRLWTWEQAKWTAEISQDYWITPGPFMRTGPGVALDGGPRFDLNQFNQAYFDRLRSRAQDAAARGVYVSVMLFNGWSIATKGTHTLNDPWKGHPFNAANNINGIDGDTNHDGSGFETQTLTDAGVTALEDAYVRKVVDAVGDLDNVLYEIDCEGDPSAKSWQYHMIQVIRDYEASKGKRHPIGMTPMWPNGADVDLYASGADWISVTGSVDDPAVADGSKVVIADTDHICGICGNAVWVWRSFTRGQNPILMDGYDGAAIGMGAADYNRNDPVWESIRKNLGYARNLAVRMNLAAALPRGDLASTGYCLAVVGSEYIVFLPGGGSARLNLAGVSGPRTVEWLNPGTGQTTTGPSVNGGSTVTLRAPFSGPAVVYVHP